MERALEVAAVTGAAQADAHRLRAPRVQDVGPGVEILARHEDAPVLVRAGRVLAATFHPELAGEDRVHRAFLASIA
jgi:5'-phosphate synthase pdxT subunit